MVLYALWSFLINWRRVPISIIIPQMPPSLSFWKTSPQQFVFSYTFLTNIRAMLGQEFKNAITKMKMWQQAEECNHQDEDVTTSRRSWSTWRRNQRRVKGRRNRGGGCTWPSWKWLSSALSSTDDSSLFLMKEKMLNHDFWWAPNIDSVLARAALKYIARELRQHHDNSFYFLLSEHQGECILGAQGTWRGVKKNRTEELSTSSAVLCSQSSEAPFCKLPHVSASHAVQQCYY
jgi:hypothetical protein